MEWLNGEKHKFRSMGGEGGGRREVREEGGEGGGR